MTSNLHILNNFLPQDVIENNLLILTLINTNYILATALN